MNPFESRVLDPLRRRARRAYEVDRVWRAVLRAWPVVPLTAAALAGCVSPKLTVGLASGLAILTVALGWRGMAWGRGVSPGLLAGAPPLVLPIASRTIETACWGGACTPGACLNLCTPACVIGGAIAGMVVGSCVAGTGSARFAFLGAAVAVAGVTGTMGCVLGGIIGVIGMLAGFAAGTLPFLVSVSRGSS